MVDQEVPELTVGSRFRILGRGFSPKEVFVIFEIWDDGKNFNAWLAPQMKFSEKNRTTCHFRDLTFAHLDGTVELVPEGVDVATAPVEAHKPTAPRSLTAYVPPAMPKKRRAKVKVDEAVARNAGRLANEALANTPQDGSEISFDAPIDETERIAA